VTAATAIVGGSVAQQPGRGGLTWVFLQYVLGLKQLGWDVLFLDRLEPIMCVDRAGRQCDVKDSLNLRYFEAVMERFDLVGAYALLYNGKQESFGLPREKVLSVAERSAFLLNFNGFITDEEILARAPLRVFLDIDPGFGQMWQELGLHHSFQHHDVYVTVGENIGTPQCTIPTCGLDWVTTPQPVVLDYWPAGPPEGTRFTSVASWRGPYGPVEYRGKTYGLRVHEYRKFVGLPCMSPEDFEIALDIDSQEVNDLALLRANDWTLVDPRRVAGDPWTYQRYVQQSKAEFSVAKTMYVETWSGWFSDRSICYLASGRPVLAQETGFSRLYPVQEGLLTFVTLDDAVAGVEEISGDYDRHARAARGIAEEYFDSKRVLSRLLEAVGVT
jgi:hypothetical protein